MQADVDSVLWSSIRERFERNIRKAHFLARDKENCEGLEEGIAVLNACITELLPAIEDTRAAISLIKSQTKCAFVHPIGDCESYLLLFGRSERIGGHEASAEVSADEDDRSDTGSLAAITDDDEVDATIKNKKVYIDTQRLAGSELRLCTGAETNTLHGTPTSPARTTPVSAHRVFLVGKLLF